jgi:hypothetical protein
MMTDHAVANCLRRLVRNYPPSAEWEPTDAEPARAVLRFGRPYVGIARPKGFRRQRARKQCFMNAAELALSGRGAYVEGFATPALSRSRPVPHAWITLDGEHAIDQTWPDADRCQYFGIPFSNEVLIKAMNRRGNYAVLHSVDVLQPVDYDLLELRAA